MSRELSQSNSVQDPFLGVSLPYFREHLRTVDLVGAFVLPEEGHLGGLHEALAVRVLPPVHGLHGVSAGDVARGLSNNRLEFHHCRFGIQVFKEKCTARFRSSIIFV